MTGWPARVGCIGPEATMCLSPEFFNGRDALVLAREAAGDGELEHFLKPVKRTKMGPRVGFDLVR